jgi:uncharacterized protein
MVTSEEAVAMARDPKDDKFLALAIAGAADCVISGDKDLLTLGSIGTVPILSPADFLASLKR